MNINQKIIIENNFQKPIILCIEPWAVEYGMMANEQFEIVSENEKEDGYFHVVFENERVTVFVEGNWRSYPQVLQNGKLLEYGHNWFETK